jgi:hypothetical protein
LACITPNTIKNPRPSLGNQLYIHVPCGKCETCLKRRAFGWVLRLLAEEAVSKTASFITLTYNEQSVPYTGNGNMTLAPRDHTLFMKRLRKRLKTEKFTSKLKYYAVGEYGSKTNRPHFHSILFNLPDYYRNNEHRLAEIWENGNVQIDEVTANSIAYVCGYVDKQKFFNNLGEDDDRLPEFSRMSKGIGLSYATPARVKKWKNQLNPYIVLEDGKKAPMPRYFKQKFLTESEREIMARKALKYASEHPQFIDDVHHLEYVKNSEYQRKKKSIQNRNKI